MLLGLQSIGSTINFAFSSNYYPLSTSPTSTLSRCLPLRSIKHSMTMTLEKGFSASSETMRRTTQLWQCISQTSLPSRITFSEILTSIISCALLTWSTWWFRSSLEQPSLPWTTTTREIWTLAMATILHLISATTIWPLEESFQNYEASPIPFAEALADGNYLNKLDGLVKLHRPPFCKMSPFDGTWHFECCNQ